MNNKGFTLVELIAVMVILISISLITVASITSSLERRGEKEKEEQVELAIGAAKIYFSLEGGTCVMIQSLIDKKYISDEKKIDSLKKSFVIRLDDETNEYKYSRGFCTN